MNLPGYNSDFFHRIAYLKRFKKPASFPQCQIHADPINKSLYK